jgi:hypothetical protein
MLLLLNAEYFTVHGGGKTLESSSFSFTFFVEEVMLTFLHEIVKLLEIMNTYLDHALHYHIVDTSRSK